MRKQRELFEFVDRVGSYGSAWWLAASQGGYTVLMIDLPYLITSLILAAIGTTAWLAYQHPKRFTFAARVVGIVCVFFAGMMTFFLWGYTYSRMTLMDAYGWQPPDSLTVEQMTALIFPPKPMGVATILVSVAVYLAFLSFVVKYFKRGKK